MNFNPLHPKSNPCPTKSPKPSVAAAAGAAEVKSAKSEPPSKAPGQVEICGGWHVSEIWGTFLLESNVKLLHKMNFQRHCLFLCHLLVHLFQRLQEFTNP